MSAIYKLQFSAKQTLTPHNFMRVKMKMSAALSFFLLCFLLFVSLAKTNDRMKTIMTSSMAHEKISRGLHPNLGLNFASKRRVPSGADPIHNRKVGTAKSPPT
ncbi:clavata3/esr-related 25 family protein [Striga asiatica]|uniref:Clavata3/esr-related 25 family protein n=1 Tax=Striga asiatica TaxID=4170 RepID=A0A5A7PSJ2_STRAF|nr:clavata3/esr-related 25 family protein [Striga asiatica]